MIWSKFEQSVDEDLAENEVSSYDGFVYVVNNQPIQKTTLPKIEVKRTETKGILYKDVKNVIGLRGKNREEKIKELTGKVMDFMKTAQKQSFSKDTLNMLCEGIKEDRTRQNITSSIINLLKKQHKIRKVVTYKNCYYFINKQLTSTDYESYNVLMAKNRRLPREMRGCYTNGNKSVIRRYMPFKVVVYELI